MAICWKRFSRIPAHYIMLFFIFQKMGADTRLYSAWFYDPRFAKRFDMSIILSVHNTRFYGSGKDRFGSFDSITGVMNLQNKKISFLRSYHSHDVEYNGVLRSWKTLLGARGTWKLADFPEITGTWGMVLEGSHDQPARST